MDIAAYVLIALIVLVIVFAKMSIVIISQSETKIIERLGKYYATLQPGINIIIPFIDHAKDIVALKAGRYTYTNSIDLVSRYMTLIGRMLLRRITSKCR